MSNHKNLLFFNKEGDNLNFSYSEANDRFEGNILFHENSNDTFKTAGLYTLEKIPSFEFEYPGEMTLNKFQLFNEFGFDFYAGNYTTQSITKIEPINNDPNFYSKWIYGDLLDKSFPIGTIIRFDSTLLEFTNLLQTYTVVGTKKGAIMIISSVDNATFETNFYNQYIYDITYVDKSISGVNAIGVYNYIDDLYKNKLSVWNEPSFYDKLYKKKKLNIVNSNNNNNIFTVKENEITDTKFFEYYTSTSDISNQDLIIEVSTKTDLPKIYDGSLSLQYTAASFSNPELNRISFGGLVPAILKPGKEFKIIGSNNNQNFFTVANIPSFTGNTQQTFYATQSQVIYENVIYECIQAYTQSFANTTTQFVTPNTNTNYWTNIISYIPVDQQIVTESLSSCQIYLTTDKIYFQYGWTQSNEVTLASAAQKYVNDLKVFNVELYYEDSKLKADLMYPSKYVEINFYQTSIGPTYSVTKTKETYERLIQVVEPITKELNYNFSENFSLNIVFTDLDEYGFKIKLNKQVFEEEIAWIYSGASPDMQRTIDRTLRAWLTRNYVSLQKLGIIAELQYIGSFASPFYNSIKLRTDYPNVEFNLNEVLVGTTADYYIEHSRVLFNDMGNYLSLTINSDTYDQDTIYLTGTYSQYPDIPATLQAWVDEHGDYLNSFGILVSNINNLLKFNVKRVDRRLDYSISTGKSTLPGINDYIITDKIKGNLGVLIASNEVNLSSTAVDNYSFEDAGFATGMAFSVNNTFHTWNNQEYNITNLDGGLMNLSYQGPFWATNNAICNSSPFITLAFEVGFGQTGCGPIVGPTGGSASGGPFNLAQFSSAFSLTYNLNSYSSTSYALSSSTSNNLVDILYVQLSNSLYTFGDGLTVIDSYLGNEISTITLPGNTQSIAMRFNGINNYLYCLSRNKVYVIDPLLNTIVNYWTLTNNAVDMQINTTNGDVYISFSDVARVEIYTSNALLTTPIPLTTSSTLFPGDATSTGTMVFNEFEEKMYVITNSSTTSVFRVLGSTRTIQTTFGVPGATGKIFYEPVNESVYVYGSGALWKIDNGVTASIPSVSTSGFEDIIYNNLSGNINTSDSSTSFKALDLTTNDVVINASVGNYGYLALSQFDGAVYLSSKTSNVILVINPVGGNVVHTESLSVGSDKIIYNPDRKSIWTIQPSTNSVLELEVTLNSVITPEVVGNEVSEDNLYGTLDPNYVPHPDLWLKTKEYLRKPRENFTGDVPVTYYFKWYSDISPEFFMYDFSGTQLTTGTSYSYTGPKPLPTAVLNSKPNKDLTKLNAPEYQQTIFGTVSHTLSYIDDEDDISTAPEPLELFLGFRADEEGAIRSILQLYKKEDIFLTFNSTSTNNSQISFETLDVYGPDKRGLIKLNTNSPYEFTGNGLKEGQLIAIYVKDLTNKKKQYISDNNGTLVKIRNVFYKSIIVDFIGTDDYLFQESTVISDYPATGNTTYCRVDIKVVDREIGRFITYGQTEIEDIRFKTELGNIGKLVAPNEVFIFKDYDILEGGIDWTYLNKKRKEMLMMKHLIYPYIGAYKSIINAINFFGYNDLQLNEYYRNINPQSEKFLKLFKMEIPDIFDNTVEGWTESEFIKNNFPNNDYEDTNMFNLTYNITDIDGNIVLNYSIDEIIIKLQGLKYWLKRNIIPLTHKILDITGKGYFNAQTQIQHTSYDIQIFNIKQNMTPISFRLNEAYLMPINSGSTVYNCVVDFYTILDKIGADKNPTGLTPPPKPFNGVDLELPDYLDITVRTYKTYKEWYPFTTYNKGDKISYYGKIYESQIDSNKIHNPRKYENTPSWVSGASYSVTNIVEYNRDVFVYSGLGSTASTTPIIDTQNWLKITEWKEINYEPVQTIKEFRQIPRPIGQSTTSMLPPPNPILPFNFTIDSNIDPFIVIEVTTDNGYGLIYRDKKNYEIRGLKDLREPVSYIDLIGPFQPITPIY